MGQDDKQIELDWIKQLKIHEADGTANTEELKIVELYDRLDEMTKVASIACRGLRLVWTHYTCDERSECPHCIVHKHCEQIESLLT